MIGWYVHHQGSGHLRRMLSVTSHLAEPVTVLSSLSAPVGCDLPWLLLARDDEDPAPRDPEAGGTLHWAPLGDPGLRERTGQIVEWVRRWRPSLVVVDVSVEVALVVRLTGTAVLVMAMPGDRTDPPHRLAYDAAEAIVAPWPAGLEVERWPGHWTAKTSFVGSISRFDGLPGRAAGRAAPREAGRRALLLWGFGGDAVGCREMDDLRTATPGWTWNQVGSAGVRTPEEVWAALLRADVVVSHAGQNAVAEVAAARAPAVVVATARPFDEQEHTARALDGAGIAVGVTGWPGPEQWPELLTRALARGGRGWSRWSTGTGAQRAAGVVESLARSAALSVAQSSAQSSARSAAGAP